MKRKDIYRVSLIIIISIFMIICTTNSFAQPKGKKGAPSGGKGKGKGSPPPTFISPYPAGSVEDEILKVVANFDKAFNSNNYELISSVWWHSKKISRFRSGPHGAFLEENWKLFDPQFKARAKKPLYIRYIGRHNSKVTLLDDDTAIVTSYLINRRFPPNQDHRINHLRQTLVFQKIQGKWLIAHMHLSKLPE
ncbi:MAG: nuclear transport factor 2 family protein [Deltaproteobacteria bacterium]|nr:nuclear transport factor 2 family protein [Deltaproteobacteria bacterium]